MKHWRDAVISAIAVSAAWTITPWAQSKSDVPEARFLTVGNIEKIDLKGKSIALIQGFSVDLGPASKDPAGGAAGSGGAASRGGANGNRGGRGGGGYGGGRGGRGRARSAGGGSTSGSIGRQAAAPLETQFKVKLSSGTILKDDGKKITLADLVVGDRIQISSSKGGSTLDAIEVDRLPRPSLEAPEDGELRR